jgi:hypothetical protein
VVLVHEHADRLQTHEAARVPLSRADARRPGAPEDHVDPVRQQRLVRGGEPAVVAGREPRVLLRGRRERSIHHLGRGRSVTDEVDLEAPASCLDLRDHLVDEGQHLTGPR